MTSDDHSITPPQWLIDQRDSSEDSTITDDYVFFTHFGADQQLLVCLKWLRDRGYGHEAFELQKHCRPSKPQPPQTVVIDGHTYRLEE